MCVSIPQYIMWPLNSVFLLFEVLPTSLQTHTGAIAAYLTTVSVLFHIDASRFTHVRSIM